MTQLPRLTSNTNTIKASLKRKLSYKHHVYSLNIRPKLVREAAQFLQNTTLYKENVTFYLNWNTDDATNTETEEMTSTSETNSRLSQVSSNSPQEENNNGSEVEKCHNDEDDWCEVDDAGMISGEADALLTTPDFIEGNERDYVYNFAPGERNIPISVFLQKDSEEMAFPGIFCGEPRPSNAARKVKVSYGDIVKSELRNCDRRAAGNVENLFFKTKKSK